MASYVIKLANLCSGGGHCTVNVTGDATFSFGSNTEELRVVFNEIKARTNKEKGLILLALHADLNGQTLVQLRTETLTVNGVAMTI